MEELWLICFDSWKEGSCWWGSFKDDRLGTFSDLSLLMRIVRCMKRRASRKISPAIAYWYRISTMLPSLSDLFYFFLTLFFLHLDRRCAPLFLFFGFRTHRHRECRRERSLIISILGTHSKSIYHVNFTL